MLYVFVCVVYVCLLVCMFVSMCVPMDTYVCIWKLRVNVECLPWLLATSLRQSTPRNPQSPPPEQLLVAPTPDFYVDSGIQIQVLKRI